MKKRSIVIIASVVAVLIVATAAVAMGAGMKINILKTHGINAILELEENASTGYSWHYELENGSIVEIIKDEYFEEKNDSIVGAAGKHIWEFQGISPGKAIVKLEYYRTWEGVEGSADSRIYEINVDNAGKADIIRVK